MHGGRRYMMHLCRGGASLEYSVWLKICRHLRHIISIIHHPQLNTTSTGTPLAPIHPLAVTYKQNLALVHKRRPIDRPPHPTQCIQKQSPHFPRLFFSNYLQLGCLGCCAVPNQSGERSSRGHGQRTQ